jgi:hypothetical protein
MVSSVKLILKRQSRIPIIEVFIHGDFKLKSNGLENSPKIY